MEVGLISSLKDQPWIGQLSMFIFNYEDVDRRTIQGKAPTGIYLHILHGKTEVGISEPLHDKTNQMSARPAKTQISLGIRPV